MKKTLSRIQAALEGVLESAKSERKIKKVQRSIENSLDNAQERIEDLTAKLTTTLAGISKTDDVNTVIQNLANIKGDIEEQEDIIGRLKWVKEFVNGEVEVDVKEEKK